MKAFYALFLLVFLASCTGANVEENSSSETDTSVPTQQEETMADDSMDQDESSDDMLDDEDEAMKTEESDDMDGEDTMDDMEEEMADEMDKDTAMLEETASNEVMTLDASYNNPKGNVDMMVNLSVDENDVIQSLEVTATTYDVTDFNAAVQELVGQDISAAEEFYVAGGSLTSDAFTSAIKNR